MTIGDRLRAAREAAGLSQAEVAQRARMQSGQVSRIESNKRSDPAFSTVRAIAGAIGVSLDDLAADQERSSARPGATISVVGPTETDADTRVTVSLGSDVLAETLEKFFPKRSEFAEVGAHVDELRSDLGQTNAELGRAQTRIAELEAALRAREPKRRQQAPP